MKSSSESVQRNSTKIPKNSKNLCTTREAQRGVQESSKNLKQKYFALSKYAHVEKVPLKQLQFAKHQHTEVLKLPLHPKVKCLQLLPYPVLVGWKPVCCTPSSSPKPGEEEEDGTMTFLFAFSFSECSTPTTVFLKNKAACQEPKTPILDKRLLAVRGTEECLLLIKAAP